MDDTGTSFGQWLKRHRSSRDLTQAELANRLGVALVTLRKIESGERRPSKKSRSASLRFWTYPQPTGRRLSTSPRAIVGGDVPLAATAMAPPPTSTDINPRTGGAGPTGRRRRSNLPLRLSSFVGREAQIAELLGVLQSVRLLTLTGRGRVRQDEPCAGSCRSPGRRLS